MASIGHGGDLVGQAKAVPAIQPEAFIAVAKTEVKLPGFCRMADGIRQVFTRPKLDTEV